MEYVSNDPYYRLNAERRGFCTPRLDIQCNKRLGCRLHLALLLLPIRREIRLSDLCGLDVFLVVRAKKIDVVVFLGCGRCVLRGVLGGVLRGVFRVQRGFALFGAVRRVRFRRIAGEGGELGFVGRDVLVPAVSVRVFAGVRGALEGFVAGDIGLRRAVADGQLVQSNYMLAVVPSREQ